MVSPGSTAEITGHPLHHMLVAIPMTCFVGTWFSDILYAVTSQPQWADLSSWLLAIGLVVAFSAGIAGLIDVLREPRIRNVPNTWIHAVGNGIAVILSLWNAWVHSQEGYIGVVPTGLVLSASVVIILAVTGWNGWRMVHRVGTKL